MQIAAFLGYRHVSNASELRRHVRRRHTVQSTKCRCGSSYLGNCACRWILSQSVRRQTYGYLPGRTALSPGQYFFPVPPSVGGGVGLSNLLRTNTAYPQAVTHLSTNRARRRLTSLTWPVMPSHTLLAQEILLKRRFIQSHFSKQWCAKHSLHCGQIYCGTNRWRCTRPVERW